MVVTGVAILHEEFAFGWTGPGMGLETGFYARSTWNLYHEANSFHRTS